MGTPQNPTPGDLHIDATGQPIVRYQGDHIRTLSKLRPGHPKAVANLALLTDEQRKAAGISKEEVDEVLELEAEHQKLEAFYEASADMTEGLRHTLLDRGHKISTRLAEATEQARRRAERSPNGAEILGSLADLIEYQLAPAQKATATKAKAKAGEGKDNSAPAKPSVNVTR